MSTPSSWFDDVIEAISETKATTTLISPQPSESIDTEEIFKSVSHRTFCLFDKKLVSFSRHSLGG